MRNKFLIYNCFLLLFFSCSQDNDEFVFQNLQEYIDINADLTLSEVIACAASEAGNTEVSYVFYYPEIGATNIRYFETSGTNIDEKNFSLYTPLTLPIEAVFNGYLEKFIRTGTEEAWCIVTYLTEGKLHKSNPIRLKHQSKPTEWTNQVQIDFSQTKKPKFSWQDGVIKENAIYFEVLTNATNDLLSATYTYDTWFRYYELGNVVLNVTRNSPPDLTIGTNYNFTMMGVSLDNWVNLVIQKQFTAQ